MKKEELLKHFYSENIDEAIDINPLTVAEITEFHRSENRCYKERAIRSVIEKELPFCSTENSIYQLFKSYVKILCPYCEGEMTVVQGYGDSNFQTINYECIGKHKVSISLIYNGFYAGVK